MTNVPQELDPKLRFKRWLAPILDALRTLGESGTPRQVIDEITRARELPDEITKELRKSSGQPRYPSQVQLACLYLKKEGLVDSYKHGVWSLTEKGRDEHLSLSDALAIVSHWDEVFAANRPRKRR